MIISHEHKFIFIHIGKTGGTSIEKVLCERLDIDFENTKRIPEMVTGGSMRGPGNCGTFLGLKDGKNTLLLHSFATHTTCFLACTPCTHNIPSI